MTWFPYHHYLHSEVITISIFKKCALESIKFLHAYGFYNFHEFLKKNIDICIPIFICYLKICPIRLFGTVSFFIDSKQKLGLYKDKKKEFNLTLLDQFIDHIKILLLIIPAVNVFFACALLKHFSILSDTHTGNKKT